MATSGVNQSAIVSSYQLETQNRMVSALDECSGQTGPTVLETVCELNPVVTGNGLMNIPYTIANIPFKIVGAGTAGLGFVFNLLTQPFRFAYYLIRSETPQELACRELQSGDDTVRQVDLFGRGALMQKVSQGSGALKVFAMAGADTNIRAHKDFSNVLHEIARLGDPESLNILLSSARAVNLNSRDVNDMSPMHMAALSSNPLVLAALLVAKADPLAVDRLGRNPLMIAAKYCAECFDLLAAREVNFLGRDKQNAGVWHYAAANPAGASVMSTLYKQGISAHQVDFDGETPIHYASKLGVANSIGNLVYYGLDANALTKDGSAPVHLASEEGHSDVIYKLAANGADMNLPNANQESPLHLAAKHGFSSCIEALVYNKAEINKQDQYGRTPLVIALLNQNEDAAQKLVSLGADVNLTPYNRHTPLYIALKRNLNEVASSLTQKGAIVKAGKNDALALHEAVAQDDLAKVNNLILNGVQFNQRDNDFQTALMIALMRGNMQMTQKLLNYANLNKHPDLALVLDAEDRMAIHYAAMNGNASVVSQILRVMRAPASPDIYGRLPTHYAAEKGNLLALIELTKQTKKVEELDLEDENGHTPLNLAILNGHHSVAQHLIDSGASIVRINPDGQASIHLAAQKGDLELAKMLIERNSILINWKDRLGNTPLSYCEEGSEIQQYLIDKGGKILVDGYAPIQLAIMQDDDEFLKLSSGSQLLESKNLAGGNTNLHLAVKAQSDKAAKVLMSAESSLVNYQNEEGDTPLIIAARKGETSTVVDLIEHGADVRLANKEGLTALHVLARQGDVAGIKAVLLKHPNLNAYSKGGLTPLGVAISANQKSVAFLLTEMGAIKKVQDHVQDESDSIPFLNLIQADKFSEVQNFLLAGVTDVADRNGNRALHYAVSLGVSEEMLTSLINAGFDINATDHYGRTPLMLAVQNENFSAIKVLLGRNNKITRQDLENMLRVAKARESYNEKIVAIIEEKLDTEF